MKYPLPIIISNRSVKVEKQYKTLNHDPAQVVSSRPTATLSVEICLVVIIGALSGNRPNPDEQQQKVKTVLLFT